MTGKGCTELGQRRANRGGAQGIGVALAQHLNGPLKVGDIRPSTQQDEGYCTICQFFQKVLCCRSQLFFFPPFFLMVQHFSWKMYTCEEKVLEVKTVDLGMMLNMSGVQ